MSYPQVMENGLHHADGVRDKAQIARGDRLVDATPEAVRELAESAMLLSQGADRAIEMMRGTDHVGVKPAALPTSAVVEARRG